MHELSKGELVVPRDAEAVLTFRGEHIMWIGRSWKHLHIVGAMVLPTCVFAQQAPPVAQGAGVPSRDQLEAQQRPDDARAPSRVRVDSSTAFDRAPCPLDESSLVTDITEVRFTTPSGAPMAPEIARLVGGIGGTGPAQPIRAICDIRDRANAALRRAKYVATVQIPAQRMEGGVVVLEVVTARIVEMRVRGDPGPYEDLLKRRIERLKALDPLNEAEAERLLLLAGDVPGLDVQLALSPSGGAPGDVIGDLLISYVPLSVIANVQNYNSRHLGRETGYVRAEAYGLTGAGDLTFAGVSTTADFKEQIIGQLGHQMALDDGGTTVGITGTYAISRPVFDSLRLNSKTWIAGVEVARPLVRTVNGTVRAAAGFEYSSQRTLGTDDIGTQPLSKDKASALYLRLSGEARSLSSAGDEVLRTSGWLEVRQGIDVLGSTDTGVINADGSGPSRIEGNARATIVRGQAKARVSFTPWLGADFEMRGQWANDPLLNLDEFSIGNLTIGRGYDPGSNSGDRAIGGSAELRVRPLATRDYALELFGFYDAVKLWNLDTNALENGRLLRSYGGGARLVLPGAMVLELTYAHPHDKALLTDRAPPPDRLLFSLTVQLVPFGGSR